MMVSFREHNFFSIFNDDKKLRLSPKPNNYEVDLTELFSALDKFLKHQVIDRHNT